MTLKMIHHHGFTVSNIEQSLKFYRDVLDLEVVRISERKELPSYDTILGYENVHLRVAILTHPVNDFVMEIFEYVNPPSTKRELTNYYVGSSHLAFEVDNIDEQYEKVQAAGFDSINPPVDVMRDGRKIARAMYVLDPDGISVELFQEFADMVGG